MQIKSVFVMVGSFCLVKKTVGIVVVRYRLNLVVSMDRVSVSNRRSLCRNRELVYWLRAVPRPVRRWVLCLRLYRVLRDSILGSIARY
jgi:hypothetical protein